MLTTAPAPAATTTVAAGQFDDAPASAAAASPSSTPEPERTTTSPSTYSPLSHPVNGGGSEYDDKGDNDEEEYYDDDDDDDAYYNDYDDYDDPDDGPISIGGSYNSTKLAAASSCSNSSKMNLSLSHSVANSVAKMQDLEVKKRSLTQGRDDRATSEQVLDPRTRLILFKLLSRGFLSTVDGCLSTGKEANVYYAKAGGSNNNNNNNSNNKQQQQTKSQEDPSASTIDEYAIKIYKTSILVFKDRDKYVSGENRWKRGYCKSNPRKMVKLWAEKEMRNYKRIHQAFIPCPKPVLLKSNVLIMEFLGQNGWPSPRLKDTNLNDRKMRQAYIECILILRHLYQRCKLVHGDLSEYNLLWHNNSVYVIDVSQSVESDHPSALDFLRKDVSNINDYFRKVGRLNVMTTRQLFDYVTAVLDEPLVDSGKTMDDVEMESLEKIMDHVTQTADRLLEESDDVRRKIQQQEDVDEAVFMSSFLPRSLNLTEYEIQKLERGDVEDTYAHAVANLTGNTKVVDAVLAAKKTTASTESVRSILSANTAVQPPSTPSEPERIAATATKASSETGKSHVPQQDEDRQQRMGHGACVISSDEVESDPGNQDPDEEDDDGHSSDDDNSNQEESEYDYGSDEEEEDRRYVKVPKTREELEAEKLAKRTQRKLNKKAVKEAHSERRQHKKMKKRDKKRAIKKSKAGNRKNKK